MSPLRCNICDLPTSILCSSCSSIAYCSVECQHTDLPVHQLLCKARIGFPPRPSRLHILGILFPVDSKIQLVWVECRRWHKKADFEPNVSRLLGEDEPVPDYQIIERNAFRGYNLNHRTHIYYRDALSVDNSSRNISVVMSTQGLLRHDWKGPVVVLRGPASAFQPRIFQDVTMADFRVAVDYFIQSGNETKEPAVQGIHLGAIVSGVRINCDGDMNLFNVERYVAVRVPRDHPIYKVSKPVEISRLLDFSILVWKYPHNTGWTDDEPYLNLPAAVLQRGVDPNGYNWGSVPFEWMDFVGSVLVVRQDGKEITPHQVEVLCHFCHHGMQRLFEVSKDEAPPFQRARWEVVGLLNRPYFQLYFKEYAESRVRVDPTWESAKPPP